MDRNHGLTKTDTLGQQFLDRPGTPQIGRQDRRGEPQRRSIRGIRRENRPPDGFLTLLIPEPLAPSPAPRQSRSEYPARADDHAGPTACGQPDRSDRHERRETWPVRPQPPAQSDPAHPGAANLSAGRVKILLARETRQPYPSSCGISFAADAYVCSLGPMARHGEFSARTAARQQRLDMPPNPPVTNFQL